jgi:hypothetical protein
VDDIGVVTGLAYVLGPYGIKVEVLEALKISPS